MFTFPSSNNLPDREQQKKCFQVFQMKIVSLAFKFHKVKTIAYYLLLMGRIADIL